MPPFQTEPGTDCKMPWIAGVAQVGFPAITVRGGLFLEQVLVDIGRHDRDCHA